jgi:hypothetical protein
MLCLVATQVTVPILLSLGVGVMKAQRERKQLQEVLEDAAVRQGEGKCTF